MDERDKRVHFMTPPDPNTEREQIQQAIAAQESLRGVVDEAIIEASSAALKQNLAALEAPPEQQRKLATILFLDIAAQLTHSEGSGWDYFLEPEAYSTACSRLKTCP
jgi:hypothetical protein